VDEIAKFTNGKAIVQILRSNQPLNPDAHVYIVGILKARTLNRRDLSQIGTVIVDEAHICTITAFTQSLLRFLPRYLIGLSATPERADGMQILLQKYFGSPKDYIVRSEVKSFTVYKYQTRYQPEVSYQIVNGRTVLAWTQMLTSLADIQERWEEIAQIAIQESNHKIIIIVDRTKMAQGLHDYLQKNHQSSVLFIGSQKTWDRSKRILITNSKKGGVGLNDPSLTLLILAADMKNVKQCEGRIRTTDNVVYDIVDDYRTLENHWKLRREWYALRGATIIERGVKRSSVESSSGTKEVKRYLK
jgi:superfamily II DNA or RNA helicase